MFVELLSEDRKRHIFTTLLMCVECDKSAVEKSVKYRDIFETNNGFFMNYSNGYETKAVEIDDFIATISSETQRDNLEITRIYQNEMLKIFKTEYAQFLHLNNVSLIDDMAEESVNIKLDI